MNRFAFVLLSTLAVALAAAEPAPAAIVLQPNETDSKDTFVYEGISAQNFDTTKIGAFFGAALGVGQTTTGHTTESLLEFDLSGVTLTAAQVTSATLELRTVSTAALGFGANPTPGTPVLVDLHALAASWSETDVTWDTPPPSTAGLYASTSIDAIDTTYSFDVTDLVKDWLDGSLANNGMILKANAPVPSGTTFAAATFSSSSGGVAPKLTIVPEPASVVLGLSAAAALAWVARARRIARRRI